jgi:hypothetical protein
LSGLGTWHNGHPLTVNLNIDNSLVPDGNANNVRPDIVPGVSLVPQAQNANNWVNPAAFSAPPADANGVLLRFGNAGRSLISSPFVWLQREFKLTKGSACSSSPKHLTFSTKISWRIPTILRSTTCLPMRLTQLHTSFLKPASDR